MVVKEDDQYNISNVLVYTRAPSSERSLVTESVQADLVLIDRY